MEDNNNRTIRQKLWEGAFILTIAGLFIKILSAFYRIPYQNIAGDIGFYIYQQVYPINGIAIVLSTYGFPVVISKIIAEKDEQQDYAGINKILITSFYILTIIGLFLFLILYLGATKIALFMGDPDLVVLIKVVSFSFLLLPILSVLRGYFQGKSTMTPTALSQVTEQMIRVCTILFLSYLLLSEGYSVYIAGAGAIFGSITGGFAAIFILVYFVLRTKKRKETEQITSTISSFEVVRLLLGQGFTICISGLILILIQLIDSFSLYSLLLSSGLAETAAKQMKGIYDRGQPLIQLGTVVATSLSLALVPLISSAKKRRDENFINKKVNLSIRLSLMVGIGAAVGLACIIEPTNIMLFQDRSGTGVLFLLSFSIIFTSLALTISPILQGLGYPGISAVIVLGGLCVKWWLNTILIPTYQSMGAALATVLAFLVIALLHWMVLRWKVSVQFITYQPLFKIIVSAFIMFLTIKGYYFILSFMFFEPYESRLLATFSSISGVILGGIVYIIAIYKGKVFTDEELSIIPMGEKLISFRK
ncbi:putative polysaccharide biosynthesis protein [Litchfieldia salsa]|uniref:Polysaccharide transporter, PST family n=1 Tax=Litchfieldia salsa TaxID=930152 RepID=A0A1H0X0L8_9BACI|nr:polysaccharide biosynthesis protein [Litchfieldia salsa]SDP96006.1 polysaccharide transporter, PST family [Litchfieldia salsa]